MAFSSSRWSSVSLLLLLVSYAASSGLPCRDQSGNAVDWWVIMKVPYMPGNANSIAASGYAYAYSDPKGSLTLTTHGLNENYGAAYNTLQQIYNNRNNVGSVAWFYYNDEDPATGSSHSSYGHTKGVAGFDSTSGFWLIHSVPRWPNGSTSVYEYPAMEKNYGQSFLCVTYPYLTFNSIGSQWLINKPYIYDFNLPTSFEADMPNLVQVIDKNFKTSGAVNQTLTLTSVGGNKFISFAKNANWDQDLYESFLAPYFNTPLLAETWQNGGGALPSFCTPTYPYDVENVLNVTLGGLTWPETKDHSKWCVSYGGSSANTWSCIGDINRQEGQEGRAGGTACRNNVQQWKDLTAMVYKYDGC